MEELQALIDEIKRLQKQGKHQQAVDYYIKNRASAVKAAHASKDALFNNGKYTEARNIGKNIEDFNFNLRLLAHDSYVKLGNNAMASRMLEGSKPTTEAQKNKLTTARKNYNSYLKNQNTKPTTSPKELTTVNKTETIVDDPVSTTSSAVKDFSTNNPLPKNYLGQDIKNLLDNKYPDGYELGYINNGSIILKTSNGQFPFFISNEVYLNTSFKTIKDLLERGLSNEKGSQLIFEIQDGKLKVGNTINDSGMMSVDEFVKKNPLPTDAPKDTEIVESITPEGDPLYTILTAPKDEETDPLILAIGGTKKEAVENFNDTMLPFIEKTKVNVTDIATTPLTNPNEGFSVVPELAEDVDINEAIAVFNNDYFGKPSPSERKTNKVKKTIEKQRKKTELPISEIVIKRLPNGKLDVKRVNNRLDKSILKRQGYLTQEERKTLSQQPLQIEEVQKRLNKNRYEFKLDPDKSEYTITDKKTAVTQKISPEIILGVDTEKGKLVAANTSNLDDIDTNNFIALSEETISDYIDDDYNLVINKQQQDTNPPKLTTTENSIDGVPSLKQKLKKVWDSFETGDKIGLAAQTLPAVYNLTRGIFEKAKNYKAIYNPYAQSALNDMKQRRFNIDRTPSRLQVQAAQKQIQDNSVSNASRMANLANLAANAQKQEDALTVQEANVNQNQLPAENARFAYQIGEGIKQAEERQRNLNMQAKADKNNMLNAGITQLGNVGQHISNIENQRRADALAIKLANMRAPNYNYENGEINWTGYTKPRLNFNTNTPNRTLEEKFEPIDFTKPPNIPSFSKPELGGSYLNAYESPLPIKSNLEYKQGGYIDADTKLKELKKLKLRLKQLKKYK